MIWLIVIQNILFYPNKLYYILKRLFDSSYECMLNLLQCCCWLLESWPEEQELEAVCCRVSCVRDLFVATAQKWLLSLSGVIAVHPLHTPSHQPAIYDELSSSDYFIASIGSTCPWFSHLRLKRLAFKLYNTFAY